MPQQIEIIGMPMDFGAGRRGVDMGPSAVRIAGLRAALSELGHDVFDSGNVEIPVPETRAEGDVKMKFLEEIAEAVSCLAERTRSTLEDGRVPVMIGGDHSAAIGSIAGVSSFYKEEDQPFGVLWLDAHGDMNRPETSPSGNIHGMPLAVSVGMGATELTNVLGFSPKVDPDRVALVGIRDIDDAEAEEIRNSGVHAFTMRDIDEKGIRRVMEEALAVVGKDGSPFHVSFDMDLVDPRLAPGVGTPVQGGTTFRESHLIMEMICDTERMCSLDLVEANPILDEHNLTARLGVGLIASAFGRRIL